MEPVDRHRLERNPEPALRRAYRLVAGGFPVADVAAAISRNNPDLMNPVSAQGRVRLLPVHGAAPVPTYILGSVLQGVA